MSWVSVTDDSPAGPTFQLRHRDERPCRSCKCGRVTPPRASSNALHLDPSLQKRCRLIQLVCKAYGNRLGSSHSAGTLLASTVCSSFTVSCNYEDKECGPLGSSRLRQIKSSRQCQERIYVLLQPRLSVLKGRPLNLLDAFIYRLVKVHKYTVLSRG